MNGNHIFVIVTFAIALLGAKPASATDLVDIQNLNINQINKQYQAASARLGPAATSVQRHAEMLALEPGSELTLLKSSQDHIGQHYRYQQAFRGVPIFGEQIVVSEGTSGNVRALFGRLALDLSADLTTVEVKLSSAQAVSIAKRAGLAQAPTQSVENLDVRKMIYVGEDRWAKMVYVVSYSIAGANGRSPSRPIFIVDANTGRIHKQWDDLRRANATGPGGNQKVGLYEYGTDYGFNDVTQTGSICTLENAHVKTVNLNHTSSGTTAFSFNCPRNTVKSINGAYSTSPRFQ